MDFCVERGGKTGKNASHQTILSAKLLTSKSIQNMFMTNTCLLKSLFVTFFKVPNVAAHLSDTAFK